MAECEKVCNYIDLPLQHASNAVLKRMKRPGTRQTYDALLTRIRERVPGVALRTTFIVGFPGETEADVEELCGFISDHAFDHVGVFTYSHEEGTSAYQLDDDVPARSKAARRVAGHGPAEAARAEAPARRGSASASGCMVDGPSPDHDLVLKARLSTQAPDIDASVFLTDCDPSQLSRRRFCRGRDRRASREYDLIARPLASKPAVDAARLGLKPWRMTRLRRSVEPRLSSGRCYNFGFEGLG